MSGVKFFPRRLSFSKICDILVAYLNVGADKEFFGVSDVAGKSNVTLHNISRNNGFLKSWGFIEESEKEPGKYRLSREAAEFAYAYRIDPNGNLTRQMLRSLLEKDITLTKFVERIRNENLSRDTVLVELPRVIGDLRADKVGLTAFLDMVTYAFQTETISAPVKTTVKLPRETRTIKLARTTEKPLQKLETPVPRANISINLTISPEISPEKLKEYIKATLEAYDEYSKNT
ncbi:MAG: hypothetical protein QXX08_03895 [Candidatus Bathyarchaeia archaeon]